MAAPPAADVAKHVAMIRARSRDNDLEGALQVFRRLEATGAPGLLVYNALLDACRLRAERPVGQAERSCVR